VADASAPPRMSRHRPVIGRRVFILGTTNSSALKITTSKSASTDQNASRIARQLIAEFSHTAPQQSF